MPYKNKEDAKANAKKHRAKTYTKTREKYHSDPKYRQDRIDQATAHRKTPLGMVMSRLRINNHYARKNGYAQCCNKAEEVFKLFSGKCDICKTP